MASQPTAQLSHAPSIQRKAVSRLGRVPSNSSVRSASASVLEAPASNAPLSSGAPVATQQSPSYFNHSPAHVHQPAAFAQNSQTFEHARNASVVSTLPIHPPPASTASVGSRGSLVYGSIAAVSTPAPASIVNQPIYADPAPQPLQRSNTTQSYDSTMSSQTPASPWPATPGSIVSYQTDVTTPLSRVPTGSSNVVAGASIVRSTSPSSASTTHGLQTCNQCRASILPNVSIFECLVCHIGGSSTRFCVYCFTTGTAASGHSQHDPSFFVTESDPAIQPEQSIKVGTVQIPAVPPHVWTARKNSAGRVWYQHRSTGYRTYLRPMAATCLPSKIPTGWQLHSTPDGKKYYFNASTGASSWTPPSQKPLPAGWREVRTPDYVPFYVHDVHQLTSWERPGDAPKLIKSKSGKVKVSNGPAAGHGVAAAGAATSLASNIAVMADAADLSPQGIIAATVAAAKFTSHGAKAASKKMKLDKLAKSKQIRRASKMFTSAASLAAIADEDGFEGGEGYDETGDVEAEDDDSNAGYGEETVVGEGAEYQQQYTETQYGNTPVQAAPAYPQAAAVQGSAQAVPIQYTYEQTPTHPSAPQQTLVHTQYETSGANGEFTHANQQYMHGYTRVEQPSSANPQHMQHAVPGHPNQGAAHGQVTHLPPGQPRPHHTSAHQVSNPTHHQPTPQHSTQQATYFPTSPPAPYAAQQSSQPTAQSPGSGAAHYPVHQTIHQQSNHPACEAVQQPQSTQHPSQSSAQQSAQHPAQQPVQRPTQHQSRAHPQHPAQHPAQTPAQHSSRQSMQTSSHHGPHHPAQHSAHASSHHAPHHSEHRAVHYPEQHQSHHIEPSYVHVYPGDAYLPAGSGLPPTATAEPYPTTEYYDPAAAPVGYPGVPPADITGYELSETAPGQEFEPVIDEPVMVSEHAEIHYDTSSLI